MQKWEYLVVPFSVSEHQGATYVSSLEGQPLNDWKERKLTFQDMLNHYGDQGWELVISGGYTCIFKRPKS